MRLLGYVLALLAATVGGAGEVGDDWIANGSVRVQVQTWPVAERWEWRIQWRDSAGDWTPAVTGTLLATGDKELSAKYQAAWKVYYLFQKTIPAEIRTSLGDRGPQMDLHVQREDLWVDLRITLPGDGPFVVIECTGKSHEALRAHTRQWLPDTMLHLTADSRSFSARQQREHHTFPSFARYCFAWRVDDPWLFALLTTAADHPQRGQWPPAGYRGVYLDAPYVLWSAVLPAPRDDDRLREYGEALWQQAQWQLPGRLAQPEDARQ